MVTKKAVEFGVTGGEVTWMKADSGKVESDPRVESLPAAEEDGENLISAEEERTKRLREPIGD